MVGLACTRTCSECPDHPAIGTLRRLPRWILGPSPEDDSDGTGYRVFKGNLDKHPTVKRIVETCMADERIAGAQPMRQPGAPSAH